MAKFKPIIIMAISLAVIITITILSIPDPCITTTSHNFVRALITADSPEDYCRGEVLYQVKNSTLNPAEVLDIKTIVTGNTHRYAKVYIVAEMKLQDGVDVGFYEAELVKEDKWEIYTLKETMPQIISFNLPTNPDIDNIYERCIANLSEGNSELLAGPARTAYKSQTGIKGEITGLQTEILYNNKLVIAKHTYMYGERLVKVLVHYYKTSEGYKIVSIQAL